MCSIASRLLSSATKILHRSSPYTCRILEPVRFPQRRGFASEDSLEKTNAVEKNDLEDEINEHNLPGTLGQEFRTFRDADAPVIFDVDEEKKKIIDVELINALQEDRDPYEGLNMEHGIKGVFDIQDLVALLKRDKAKDIFVASVPAELSYVDYIVVASARSPRHMSALATFVRKVYKVKRYKSDLLPKIEGSSSKDWMAIDLGNIALHIFAGRARYSYDLETLWTVGSEYDSQMIAPDAEAEFAEKYNKFLEGLQPADA